MLMKSMCLCVLALEVARVATPQTIPDMQKIVERLDKLEDENQKLLDEIRLLRTELLSSRIAAPQETPSAEVPPATDERLAVQESRTAELAQSKVSASQRFPVSLTGMLLFNAFENGRSSGGSEYPETASLTPSNAFDGATVSQTILGLKFNGPDLPGGGKASGFIYMDFSGNTLRIRTAMLNLKWKKFTVSVGQDKPIISPRDPDSFAQVGVAPLSSAGNLWGWNPQARIERRFSFGDNGGLNAQASVYQTSESYSAAPASEYDVSPAIERARPAYQGRLGFFYGNEHRRLEIAPGFSLGTTHANDRSVQSRIASLDWLLQPFPLLQFSGEAFGGQDVGGLGALPGFTILPHGNVIPVHSHGEWGQISLFPAPKLSFHIYAGEQYNLAADVAPSGVQRNFAYAGNLMYKLSPNVIAALEVSQTRTEYLGSLLRLNNHYDLSIAYLF